MNSNVVFSVSLVEAILISSEPNRNVVYLLTVNLSGTLTCLPVHGKHLSSRGNNHIYSWSCYFCSGKLPNAATPSRHSFALVSSALDTYDKEVWELGKRIIGDFRVAFRLCFKAAVYLPDNLADKSHEVRLANSWPFGTYFLKLPCWPFRWFSW